MVYSNIHTHSVYSDGKHSPREIIEQAIAQGMTSIGISDHSYTDFDTRYCIQKENNEKYIAELRSLKKEYNGKIEVAVGIELDGFSKGYDASDFDYIIGSCHYIDFGEEIISVDSKLEGVLYAIEKYCGGDPLKFARLYFETYAERISVMRPDVLGHVDLVAKLGAVNESSEEYKRMAVSALCASLEVCPIVEMNTGAISRGYRKEPYPAAFLLSEIKKRGGKIILSSDSHSKDTLTFYFDECLDLLRANGINSVVVYSNGSFNERGI